MLHYPADNNMSALVGRFQMEAHCQACNRSRLIYPDSILRRYGDITIPALRERLRCCKCQGKEVSVLLSYLSPPPDNIVLFPLNAQSRAAVSCSCVAGVADD